MMRLYILTMFRLPRSSRRDFSANYLVALGNPRPIFRRPRPFPCPVLVLIAGRCGLGWIGLDWPATGAVFLNGGSTFVAAGVNFTGNVAEVYGGESFVSSN